ncbi:MAG: nitroreductase [Thermoleophilia bacterium]
MNDMEFDAVIRGRRSIRRFKPEPVPHELICEILDEARWSPSWANTQAWSVYVVTGETLQRLKDAAQTPGGRETSAGPDFRMPREWPPHLAARTRQLFDLRSTAAPESSPAPGAPSLAQFYGAPCVLFFAAEKGLASDYVLFDSGLIVQSVCLAAHDKGLGTCIMAMAVRDPDALRELLPEAADKQFVIGVALGYPDNEAPVNRFERPRAQLEEFVTWAN